MGDFEILTGRLNEKIFNHDRFFATLASTGLRRIKVGSIDWCRGSEKGCGSVIQAFTADWVPGFDS